uniref:Uncharacterized protein LOC105636929 n=1 Tax=Rhizophora mucronata TaxID=61149 RepID=A0A2P2KZX6_RHIMU
MLRPGLFCEPPSEHTLKTPSTLRPPTRKVHPVLLHPSNISIIFL